MRYRAVGLAVGLALVMSACGDNADKSFDSGKYNGTYAGTWTNQSSGTTGPVTIAIATDAKTGAAKLTIDFGGNYLGLGDPPAAELSGTFDSKGALVKGTSTLFGDYNVTIDAKGAIVGVMKNVGGGVIPSLTYTGTVTDKRLDADYEVTLADGTKVNSILRMTKQG